MTSVQFKEIMSELRAINKRVGRLEASFATIMGGIIVTAFLIEAGVIKGL